MRLSHFFSKYFLWILLASRVLSMGLTAAEPLLVGHPLVDNECSWLIQLADTASEKGLPSLAESFYKKALDSINETHSDYYTCILKLSSILIQEAKYEEARQILEANAYKPDSSWYLRHAWTGLEERKWKLINQDISCIQKDHLSPGDKPWYYLLKGFSRQAANDTAQAESYFQKALASTVSEGQRLSIETLILKTKILDKALDDTAFESLEAQFHKQSLAGRFSPFSLDYALALRQKGHDEEAAQLIQEQLQLLPLEDNKDRPLLLLLLGFLKGSNSEIGRKALQDLLVLKTDTVLQASALQLLTHSTIEKNNPEFFQSFLNENKNTLDHPLLDEIYVLRAYWELSQGRLEEAENLSKNLLETKPQSKLRANAISLLAYIAWQRTPPHYRRAADYLTKLKQETINPNEQARLDLLIADCFFQNKDYESAAQQYQSLLQNTNTILPKGQIFYQTVLSYLEADKLDEALSMLDLASHWKGLDPVYTWKASWNYVYKLYMKAKLDLALNYVSSKIDIEELPLYLKLRFQWLKAQLYLLEKKPSEALQGLDIFFESLKTAESSDEATLHILASEAYILKARAYLQLQDTEQALAFFKSVREAYPDTRAARFASIEEGRYYVSCNKPVEGLRLCVQLADAFPQSEEAPIALYEAAHYAELLGQSNNLEQAIIFLERLYTEYRTSPLAYYARAKQGDLLRRLNRFESAHLVYKQMLLEYPKHPNYNAIKLLEAKTLLALDSERDDYFQAIVSTCEYLADLAKIDTHLRLEAAYTLAFTYLKKNRLEEAQQAYWRLITYCLQEEGKRLSDINRKGQYWLSRAIFDLSTLLEQRKDPAGAKSLYQMILDYNLPGTSLAKAKLE